MKHVVLSFGARQLLKEIAEHAAYRTIDSKINPTPDEQLFLMLQGYERSLTEENVWVLREKIKQ